MKTLDEKQKLEALLVIVLGFGILYLIFDLKWMLYFALGVGVLSLMFPFFKEGVLWLWFKIAHVLGWINTKILLSAVFFVVLFPVASLSKLFSKDKLQLKRPTASLFKERNHLYTKEDIENIW